MMLLRYALIIKNVGLRAYEAIPVTFIPEFNNFSILDRFSGRMDFCYNSALDQYMLLSPIQEKIDLDQIDNETDEDLEDIPQAFIDKSMARENTISLKFFKINHETLKLALLNEVEIDYSY